MTLFSRIDSYLYPYSTFPGDLVVRIQRSFSICTLDIHNQKDTDDDQIWISSSVCFSTTQKCPSILTRYCHLNALNAISKTSPTFQSNVSFYGLCLKWRAASLTPQTPRQKFFRDPRLVPRLFWDIITTLLLFIICFMLWKCWNLLYDSLNKPCFLTPSLFLHSLLCLEYYHCPVCFPHTRNSLF